MIQGLTKEQIAYLHKLIPPLRSGQDDEAGRAITKTMRTFRAYNRKHPEKLVFPHRLNP
jgi:hypothetical protein